MAEWKAMEWLAFSSAVGTTSSVYGGIQQLDAMRDAALQADEQAKLAMKQEQAQANLLKFGKSEQAMEYKIPSADDDGASQSMKKRLRIEGGGANV